MSKPRIIVVSNRLPINITETAAGLILNRSIGGLATALATVATRYPMLWIGWTGLRRRLSKKELTQLNMPENLVAVSIPPALLDSYYNRIANGYLWPILHGLKPTGLSQAADWKATENVTNRFAETIQKNSGAGDLIWIHDYQLGLLPQRLRRLGVENRIGFFLHTPFPPAATFMRWRHKKTLLQSLAQVDVLGFQTEKDVANFKECLQAADVQMRNGAIVKAFPIGIDFKAFRAAVKLPPVTNYLTAFRKLVVGEKVILSVSRLDYTKGIPEQLRAVESILGLYKPGKLIYKLIVAPSREDVAGYAPLKEEIDKTVKEINDQYYKNYHFRPIKYDYRSYGFDELNAWYRVADVLLATPIADGMNLIVKEYIAAHEGYNGTVVLSKMMGASAQLLDAVQVNSLDVKDIAVGIVTALTMPAVERHRRWQGLRKNVRKEDVFWWAESFINELTGKPALVKNNRSKRRDTK
jgi:trehalose 6-phosphate synthase/phosphatase